MLITPGLLLVAAGIVALSLESVGAALGALWHRCGLLS
jgi:hypothetical protein